ncbi:unnamed protein product, partial [Polarella glacialis]
SFVRDPVNIDATASLMRSNDDFAPRYDQRILQAYFSDRGFTSSIEDELADGLGRDPSAKDTGRQGAPYFRNNDDKQQHISCKR